MRRSRIVLVSIVSTAVGLAITPATLSSGPDASSSPQRAAATGVKFVLDFRGNLSGTWRQTSPFVGGFACKGQDLSGSLTSSVRPGNKPYIFIAYKEGRRVRVYSPAQSPPTGLVTSNRTAQGWITRYSGGQCRQVPIDTSGCGAHTFPGAVSLTLPARGRNRVVLSWEVEPETIGCLDGFTYDYRVQHFAKLYEKQLYRCGMRRPRGCRLTIGGSADYPSQTTQDDITYTSNVHVAWSVTLRAVGRSR